MVRSLATQSQLHSHLFRQTEAFVGWGIGFLRHQVVEAVLRGKSSGKSSFGNLHGRVPVSQTRSDDTLAEFETEMLSANFTEWKKKSS